MSNRYSLMFFCILIIKNKLCLDYFTKFKNAESLKSVTKSRFFAA